MKQYRVTLINGTHLSFKKMEKIIIDFEKMDRVRCEGKNFLLFSLLNSDSLKWAKAIKKRAESFKVKAVIEKI